MSTDGFYSTGTWFKARSKAIARARGSNIPCPFCGKPINWAIKSEYVVDHILNRKKHPHLAYEQSNLQTIHSACNTRKYHWTEAESKRASVGLDGFPSGSEWSR